jgi:TRAP-type mannitol/chloroaromatic compound transport system permease large subunit
VLPLFLLIGATMGSILAGLATPTEAAGIGALGAMILAVCYGRASYAALKQACISSMMTSSVVLLAVTSNIFGAVFSRMGTAAWITNALVAMPVPPLLMFAFVIALIFILGWPFEWPAIILVFLPIFYPVVEALKPSVSQTLGVPPDMFMIWFGALVAVTLQTAYLSPPVAMSAYYLKQVVKDWSLGTIYKGMFQFMVLQCVAISVVMFVPSVATYLPQQLRAETNVAPAEEADDSANRLEEDPLKAMQEEQDKGGDPLEKDDLKATK